MDRLENLNAIIRELMANEHVSHRTPSSLQEKQRMMRALMNVWSPKEISADFLRMQDAELQLQAKDKGIVNIDDVAAANSSLFTFHSSLFLWQGDITRLKVDAIVNAANAQGLGCWAPLHNCIDNCIHSAAASGIRCRFQYPRHHPFSLRTHGGPILEYHPRSLQPRLSAADNRGREALHSIH